MQAPPSHLGDLMSEGESSPRLEGSRFVLTRDTEGPDALREGLERLGAQVLSLPVVHQESTGSPVEVAAAIGRLKAGDWVLFASANGVNFLEAHRKKAAISWPEGVRMGAIGDATARAVRQSGLSCDFVPTTSVAGAFAADFLRYLGALRPRILLPAAAEGRLELGQVLTDAGLEVERLSVYRTVKASGPRADVPGHVDAVVFLSPSSVEGFCGMYHWPSGARTVSIGPTTAAAIQGAGLSVDIEATVHSIPGVLEAIQRAFRGSNGGSDV
jgi:uroporphyrinogen-III synthase